MAIFIERYVYKHNSDVRKSSSPLPWKSRK